VRLFDRCIASLDRAQRLLAPAKPVKALLHVAFGVPSGPTGGLDRDELVRL
jgi:hypothetical protein